MHYLYSVIVELVVYDPIFHDDHFCLVYSSALFLTFQLQVGLDALPVLYDSGVGCFVIRFFMIITCVSNTHLPYFLSFQLQLGLDALPLLCGSGVGCFMI